MAARGAPRDGRSLTEDEHQEPWNAGNPNRSRVVRASLLKEEGLLLSKGGKDPREELPEFVMEDRYVQGNARVTRKNSEIVKKLNGMRVLWIQYQTELTKSVPQLEIRVTMRGLSNLKNQIHRLQADIRSEGGLAYPMPALLENVPDV